MAPKDQAPKRKRHRRRNRKRRANKVNAAVEHDNMKTRAPVVPQNPSYFPQPKSKKAIDNVTGDSAKLAITRMQPFFAFENDLKPGSEHNNERSCFRFWSRNEYIIPSIVASGASGPYWSYAAISNAPIAHVRMATSFGSTNDGTPLGYGTDTPDAIYSIMNNMVELYRVVCQGYRVRNLTPIATLGGIDVCENQAWSYGAASFGVHASNAGSCQHGMKPGDILQCAWWPQTDIDYELQYWTNSPDNTSTAMIYTANATYSQSLQLEVITLYEVVPYEGVSGILMPTLVQPDPAEVMRLVEKAYAKTKSGRWSIEQCVRQDDGEWETLKGDVGAIYNGAKALFSVPESIGNFVGSVWDSIFGAERVLRVLSMLKDSDLDILISLASLPRSEQQSQLQAMIDAARFDEWKASAEGTRMAKLLMSLETSRPEAITSPRSNFTFSPFSVVRAPSNTRTERKS
jgi:hypothetical protein